MKKNLIALLMSAVMVSGSMTLPVYAEDEEVTVEFSDETDDDTSELETEEAEVPEEASTDTVSDFSDAQSEDFSDHAAEEVYSFESEAVGESRAIGGNIDWGSSGAILPTDVATAQDGCILVGVKGSYITDMKAALRRVNAIRKEACKEGVPDPRNKKRRLTASDYVPIRWSSDLEYIARIRAAEASLMISHTRPNEESCFTLKSPNGIQSFSEVLAWNFSDEFLLGIEQWYAEKSDWVKQNKDAVTGHYTAMIDPDNLYVGYATFINPGARYSTTTSGEYSSQANLDETSGPDISNCTQTIEAKLSGLTMGMSALKDLKESDSVQAKLYVKLQDSNCRLSFLDHADWKSSDPSVAVVDDSGLIRGVKKGTADITAARGTRKVTRTIRIVHVHSWDEGEVTTAASCTKDGEKTYTCTLCAAVRKEKIKASGHKMGSWRTIVQATTQREGRRERSCTVCGHKETKSIPKLKNYTFRVVSSKSAVTYNGKPQRPAITVYAGNRKLSGGYYTVSYRNNVQVGIATVTVQGKGNYKKYSGKTTFRINLQKTTLSSVRSSRKGQLEAAWKKTAGNTEYQIQYAPNARFSGAKTKIITGTRCILKGLKSKETCYVRVRSCKKTGSAYWYSGWSNVRSIKIK